MQNFLFKARKKTVIKKYLSSSNLFNVSIRNTARFRLFKGWEKHLPEEFKYFAAVNYNNSTT